ncbi:MAG TPA: hypothetical protein VMT62_09695 [Syntrophorhabdaceae bacterium]|nr:hypothetical protein [Syntrophorhabdaceae bacterium]
MKKKEEVKKPPKRMTADEVMSHVFHPEVAKHLRKHIEDHDQKAKPKK